MKKTLLIYSLACLATAAQAQVKIGTNPSVIDPSSVLELEGTNKAFYINRVSLTSTSDVITVNTPKAGMMVYNTNAGITGTGATGAGLYYFNGTNWVSTNAAGTVGGLAWLLLGNAGTVDGVNFIGTTDQVPFNIRIGNVKSGRIEFQNTGNTSFGHQTLLVNTPNAGTGAGSFNSVFGGLAMHSNTTGRRNTAVGYDVLGANTVGDSNSGVGFGALQVNVTGNNNTADGAYTLNHNISGAHNTAVGYEASLMQIADSGNTAVGAYSSYNGLGAKVNTAIGFGSLFNNITGDSNLVAGAGAGGLNFTGSNNTFLGFNSNPLATGLRWAGGVGSMAMSSVDNGLALGATDAGSGAKNTLVGGIVTPQPMTSVFVGIDVVDPSQRIDFRNGHIRNRQDVLPVVGTPLPSGNGVTGASVAPGSSDVRGMINTVGYNNSNGLTTIRVNFVYAATNPPIVNITPANESASTATWFVTADTQGFTLSFRNVYSGSNASGPAAQFNYWVIE